MNKIKKTYSENKSGCHGWWANCNLLDRRVLATRLKNEQNQKDLQEKQIWVPWVVGEL